MTDSIRERYDKIGVYHAKIAAEYAAIAQELGENANSTNDAHSEIEGSGEAATSTTTAP